ncbi:MAG: endo-1,4-beta-xylanase [Anaerolineae bacterium]|nr:endo-1,4-beta-xylanase [Anaerolineae bacterium]
MKTRLILTLITIGFLFLLSFSNTLAQNSLKPLRQMVRPGFFIGTAVQTNLLSNEAAYRDTFVREFNMLVPENGMRFSFVHPQPNQYNFTQADTLVNFAEQHGMEVAGRVGIWHLGLPDWIAKGSFTRDQLIGIMRDHITTIMTRYKGRIKRWDIVNEAIWGNSLRATNNIWYSVIGPDYIDLAFQFAHQADPDAILYINDYGTEGMNAKSDGMYNVVKSMRERGIPVHGVGLQMHVTTTYYPNPEDVRRNIERLGALGVEVQITEMDVRTNDDTGTTQERFIKQAEIYQDMLEACLSQAACTGFITWGFTDKYTWVTDWKGKQDWPLPLDANYQPKPAYTALQQTMAAFSNPVNPPVSPTPIGQPTQPSIVVEYLPDPAATNRLRVNFRAYNVQGLYGIETRCATPAGILQGISRADGDGFNSSNSFYIDQGFNASSGEWVIAASRLMPAAPISGNSLAYSLTYQLVGSGTPSVNCAVRAVDRNGRDLGLPVVNGTLSGSTPSVVEPPVINPPVLIEMPEQFSTIAGVVSYQNRQDNSGISVELLSTDYTPLAQVTTTATGVYQFTDVPSGAYIVRASAPGHLGVLRTVQIAGDGEIIDLDTDTLVAGDTDNNGRIDLLDASFIGANFNLQAPPAPAMVDLNFDNQINIGDLVLVGTNFGMIMPAAPQ